MDPRLIVVTKDPLNAETPLDEQWGVMTPNSLYYLRNRFQIPEVRSSEWSLSIDGEVEQPYTLLYEELRSLPARTILVTTECAGNGRCGLQPKADGEPWQYGAVSTAEWTGVPLREVLTRAALNPAVTEVVAYGSDGGVVPEAGAQIPFARSLPVEKALHPDTILAYAMNGELLPVHHGFPCRLVVPGWYGMASVKWLVRIEAVPEPFTGFFQVERYILPADPESGSIRPLRDALVRSLIVHPQEGVTFPRGTYIVQGLAWSGSAAVERVDVSVDGGTNWQAAEWTSPALPYTWRRWEYRWNAASPGPYVLQSRALDEAGNIQPLRAEWNRLGYANNAIQSVHGTLT